MATVGQIERPEIRFHDEISSAWETLHRSRTFRARTAAMFDLLGTTDLSGQHWLDAGCGTGTLARLLAARNCNVTGVDASPDMIAAARGHRADSRLAAAHFQAYPKRSKACRSRIAPSMACCAPACWNMSRTWHDTSPRSIACSPGALLLVSIPNCGSLLRRSYKLAHAAISRVSRDAVRYLLLRFDASPAAMQALLRQHGLTVLATGFAGSPLRRR